MIKPEDLRIGDLVLGRVSCDCIFPKGTMFAVCDPLGVGVRCRTKNINEI